MDKEERLRDYLKRASADLQRSRQRVGELEAAAGEPIAIVGMSCRFPGGVQNPDEFWSMLANGADGLTAFPDDRGWNLATHADLSEMTGGFLHDAADFDAPFFGISRRIPKNGASKSAASCRKPPVIQDLAAWVARFPPRA